MSGKEKRTLISPKVVKMKIDTKSVFSTEKSHLKSIWSNSSAFHKDRQATEFSFQWSAHLCPPAAKPYLSSSIPELIKKSSSTRPILICPIFQPTIFDLIELTKEVELEKDLKLHYFLLLVKSLREAAKVFNSNKSEEESLIFIDGTNPISGEPIHSEAGPSLWSDVDGFEELLPLSTYDFSAAGGCKMVSHPIWRTKIYPSTIFTNASQEELTELFESI